MRLLLDDTLATLPYMLPLVEGWIAAGDLRPERRTALRAADLEPGDAALLPLPEAALLPEPFGIVPGIAAIADGVGAYALRTPVRPDEIEGATVRLLDVSPVGVVLARATVGPYFGIAPIVWTTEADPAAQAVVVEGLAALRPVEGGFSEDLARAWFILTGLPVVSHVLAAPVDLEATARERLVATLTAAREMAQARRQEWRAELAADDTALRDGIESVYRAERYTLEPEDRRAMVALLSHGARGTIYPTMPVYRWLE